MTQAALTSLLERLEKRLSGLWTNYPWLLPSEVTTEITDIQALLKELRDEPNVPVVVLQRRSD